MTDFKKQQLLNKYQDHLAQAQGGIFTKSGRERLLGIARKYGGDESRTLANFWNRTTTYVENALVDLDLFIQSSEKERVDKVISADSLRPIVQDLLWAGAYNDRHRAEIAQLFIQEGFRYLESSLLNSLSQVHQRSISEAFDLSRVLVMDIALGKGG